METYGAIWGDSFVESDFAFGPLESKYSPKAGDPCLMFAVGAPGYAVISGKYRPDDARARANTTWGRGSVYGVWGPYAEEFQLMAS